MQRLLAGEALSRYGALPDPDPPSEVFDFDPLPSEDERYERRPHGMDLRSVKRSFQKLDGRHQKVLFYRFFKSMDLDDVGKKVGGVSRERARQLEWEALQSLRDSMSGIEGAPRAAYTLRELHLADSQFARIAKEAGVGVWTARVWLRDPDLLERMVRKCVTSAVERLIAEGFFDRPPE